MHQSRIGNIDRMMSYSVLMELESCDIWRFAENASSCSTVDPVPCSAFEDIEEPLSSSAVGNKTQCLKMQKKSLPSMSSFHILQ